MECSPGVGYVLLAWFYLLLPYRVARAEDDLLFATPVAEGLGVEYYDNGETRFAIFMEKVIWAEARRLCHVRKGGLVEYSRDGVSAFVGRALAESAVGFASLWIGGEFTASETIGGDGVWRWSQSQEIIESQLQGVNKFPMTTPPYWVDRPVLTSRQTLCLATDRNLHHDALIVSEPCDMRRPYICSLPKGEINPDNTAVNATPPVKIEGRSFYLFGRMATWLEAINQCRLLGMRLAKLSTAAEFRIIKNRMLRQRPIMENAWISGLYAPQEGKWVWVSNYEPINTNPDKANAVHPFIWYRPDHIINEGCLLADRHLCDHFVYVEAKCDRRRPFICEKGKESEVILPPLVKVPDTDYFISTYEENWNKAQNMCRTCLDGDLIQIETTKEGVAEQLPLLYNAMGLTLQTEVRHIWIGGYLFGTKFKWANDPSIEPGDDQLLSDELFEGLHENGEKGRLVYCKVDFSVHRYLLQFKCLNLDRENQKYFTIYGLKCHHKQHFICKGPAGQKLHESCSGGFDNGGGGDDGDGGSGGGEETTPRPRTSTPHSKRPMSTTHDYGQDKDSTSATPPVRSILDPYDYWVSEFDEDWATALTICKKCVNGYLMEIMPGSKKDLILQFGVIANAVTSGLRIEEGHMWLGGYLYDDKWKWTKDKDHEPGDDKRFNPVSFQDLNKTVQVHMPMDVVTMVPTNSEIKKDCLIVHYVQDNDHSVIPWMCGDTQKFICQSEVGSTLNTVDGTRCDLLGPLEKPDPADEPESASEAITIGSRSGQNAMWVMVTNEKGYWINVDPGTWNDTIDSCGFCLSGEIIKIVDEDKGQQKQMQMINNGMRNTLTKGFTRLWLGNYSFEGEFISKEGDPPPGMYPKVQPHGGKPSYLTPRCPRLLWNKGGEASVGEDDCTVKRHAICHTDVKRRLDTSCYSDDE